MLKEKDQYLLILGNMRYVVIEHAAKNWAELAENMLKLLYPHETFAVYLLHDIGEIERYAGNAQEVSTLAELAPNATI